MAFNLESFGATIKALASGIPFSSTGGYGAGVNVGFMPSGLMNVGMNARTNGFDPATAAGNPAENGIVAACVDAISQALADAPPFLEERKGDDWVKVDSHPLIELLSVPNQFYGAQPLWAATTTSECTTGNAFWKIKFNSLGPAEIWWEPAEGIEPVYDKDSFIKHYILKVDGEPYVIKAASNFAAEKSAKGERLVHFRYALHPQNPRWGWTPLTTVTKQIAGDNQVSIYHAAIMRNAGVPSGIVTPKEATSGVTPQQLTELLQGMERKLTGEGAGRIVGSTLPIDYHKAGFSPDEMAIDKLLGYYESRICAALKVPPMILGITAGVAGKTYNNYGEAIQDFWRRTIMPTQTRRGDELEAQMFPMYELDRKDHRISWDISGVLALQEDEDALWKRFESAVGGPFMTPNEVRARIQLDEVESGGILRKAEAPAPPEGAPEAKGWDDADIAELESQGDEAIKALAFGIKKFDPNEPRGEDGKWATGGASNATSTAAKKGEMRAASKGEAKALGIPPAYSDVLITDDKSAELKATAKNSKGKVQYYYTPEYSKKQAAAKFDRVKELHNDLPAMSKTWDAEISGGGKNAHEAMALRLIGQTGFRVGGLEGGGDVAAYGASSLQMSHVKVSGNRIEFNFISKGGHKQEHSLVDPVLARHIEARQKAGKETVFDTNDAKVRDYLKRTGGDFKVHDLRTRTASAMAAHYVGSLEKSGNTPRTAKEIATRKNQIADKVATKLGDTRSVVLSSYIAPHVWKSWS